jgi:NO-binding membrane sensor protein with MHYT domain
MEWPNPATKPEGVKMSSVVGATAVVAAMSVPSVGEVVNYQYDPVVLTLSFLISVLGSYVGLWLRSDRNKNENKVIGAALAIGGCAIWSMHFIGMAAYKTSLYVSYALLPTVLSLILVVVVTAIGLQIVQRGRGGLASLALGGGVIGGGVSGMHYLGMFGMGISASFDWNWLIVGASVLIAMVAATAALWLAFNVQTTAQRLAAALVMGVAVCAMHYTGMAAATMVCTAKALHSDFRLDGPYLAYAIFGVALTTLAGSLLFTKFEQVMEL